MSNLIEIITETNLAVGKKMKQQLEQGKKYVFQTEEECFAFYQPFHDKITGGKHILPSFIELCYRDLADTTKEEVKYIRQMTDFIRDKSIPRISRA